MKEKFDSSNPEATWAGATPRSISLFVFCFFVILVSVEFIWTFLIRGVYFSLDKAIFAILLSSLRILLDIPLILIIALGTYLRFPIHIQISIMLAVSWIVWHQLDFFMGNIIQNRVMGIDLVLNGQITAYGVTAGLIFASRDVLLAACAAYVVVWRKKK